MSKSKLILPPSGLAIPKSSVQEPAPQNPANGDDLLELIEQAGRGVHSVLRRLQEDTSDAELLKVVSIIAVVQTYLAEAQGRILADFRTQD
jgi:hypothetical protein